jgi:hypothetical protein
MTDLRDKVLGESVHSETYQHEGETFLLKALTREQMDDVREKADGSDIDFADHLIVKCTYYPEDYEDEELSGDKMFDEADITALRNGPASGLASKLALSAMHVNGLVVPDEDVEDDKKN